MSIVPFGGASGSDDPPLDAWWGRLESSLFDQLDMWDHPLFPPSLPILGRRSVETGLQVNWRETPGAHVLRAVFDPRAEVGVLVYIDDEDLLHIGTEDGRFASRFKLPEDARRDGVRVSVDGGVLTVVVPKADGGGGGGGGDRRWRNVRSVEITGSG